MPLAGIAEGRLSVPSNGTTIPEMHILGDFPLGVTTNTRAFPSRHLPRISRIVLRCIVNNIVRRRINDDTTWENDAETSRADNERAEGIETTRAVRNARSPGHARARGRVLSGRAGA